MNLVDVNERAFRRRDIAELERDIDDIDHAAAKNGDMTLIAHGRVDDLLDAVNVRRERRDNNAAARVVERLVKSCTDRALRRRMAFALRIRRIGHEHEDAAVAEVREAAEVRHLAVNWRVVELEVTRVHNHADRRLDGKAHSIRNRVIDADEADAEAADVDDIALHH